MEASSQNAVPAQAGVYGSFLLGGLELAMPVQALREVVNFPDAVTPMPLVPAFLIGLLNLRGALLPIVELSQLLGLEHRVPRKMAKIAVIDGGRGRLGILFDGTGDILRVLNGQCVMFHHGDQAGRMIEGVLKLEQGQRILQILSPHALASLQQLPRMLDTDQAAPVPAQRTALSQRRQGVRFRTGQTSVVLPSATIKEILRVSALQRSVLGDDGCMGLLHWRGVTVPVVDFANFLGLQRETGEAPGESEDTRRILVIQHAHLVVGLLVDAVISMTAHASDEVLTVPSFGQERRDLFGGCIATEQDEITFLLDAGQLMADPAMAQLLQGHGNLYASEAQEMHARSGDLRETFVTFRLEHLMGVPIDQLREVIDYPMQTVCPPGAPAFVRGMFQLRDALVPLVDLRQLYGMPPGPEPARSKVVVIENGADRYGLVVDDVENILTVGARDKMAVPQMLLRQLDPILRQDMTEVVDIGGAPRRTLMLLDTAPLKQRLAGSSEL